MKRRHRGLDDEDASLWAHVTKSVKPLAGRGALRHAPAMPNPNREEQPRHRPPPTKPVEDRVPPLAPIERRTRAALERGSESVDAVLDLHGHTQDVAHAALRRFLAGAQRDGLKFVLIVTGKGSTDSPGGGRGVLKRMVPLWLRAPELRALVVGFDEAAHRHGGAGALYVRLRRGRDPGAQ
jgi:DNA-nicking Smr family endonuclease